MIDPLVAVHHDQVDDVVEALQCTLNAAATVTTKQQVTHDAIANLDWQILFSRHGASRKYIEKYYYGFIKCFFSVSRQKSNQANNNRQSRGPSDADKTTPNTQIKHNRLFGVQY